MLLAFNMQHDYAEHGRNTCTAGAGSRTAPAFVTRLCVRDYPGVLLKAPRAAEQVKRRVPSDKARPDVLTQHGRRRVRRRPDFSQHTTPAAKKQAQRGRHVHKRQIVGLIP